MRASTACPAKEAVDGLADFPAFRVEGTLFRSETPDDVGWAAAEHPKERPLYRTDCGCAMSMGEGRNWILT